jgi:metal-responsive CopG/Arc/MetJ family transcriptional regulator
MMRTVQMTLDDELVDAVDKVAKKLKTTRSAFTRDALRNALDHLRSEELERKHRRGYERHPVSSDEFSVWEKEQDWGEE